MAESRALIPIIKTNYNYLDRCGEASWLVPPAAVLAVSLIMSLTPDDHLLFVQSGVQRLLPLAQPGIAASDISHLIIQPTSWNHRRAAECLGVSDLLDFDILVLTCLRHSWLAQLCFG